jgi:sulfur-carrier protein
VIDLDVPEGATVNAVTTPYGLPPKLVHLVLVNGHYVAPDDRGRLPLQQGDTLAIWPPVAER